MTTEEHFRQTLGAGRARVIVEELRGAIERTTSIEGSHRPFVFGRTRHNIIYDFATSGLEERFADDQAILHTMSNSQHLWLLYDAYALRWKKFSTGLTTSNVQTDQQRLISGQCLVLDEGITPVYVNVGTQFSMRTGEVIGFYAVKSLDQRNEWVVDLEDLGFGGGTAPVTMPLPGTAPAPPAVRIISRRPRVSDEAAGADE